MGSRIKISLNYLSPKVLQELIDYCFSLTVWSLGLLLVTGLDLTIVGAYRFQEVSYDAIAATLVTFLNGLFGAVFGAMSSPAAVLHAREDSAGLGKLVSTTTRFGMLLLLGTGLPMVLHTLDSSNLAWYFLRRARDTDPAAAGSGEHGSYLY